MAQPANRPIGWNTASVLTATSVSFASRAHPDSITTRPTVVPSPFVFLAIAMGMPIFARPRLVIKFYSKFYSYIELNCKDKTTF